MNKPGHRYEPSGLEVAQWWNQHQHVPIKHEEVEYAACLLMAGAPDFIAKKTPRNVNGPPVSTLGYRNVCQIWYNENVREGGWHSRGLSCDPPQSYIQKDFMAWWARYKMWLVEVYHGVHK